MAEKNIFRIILVFSALVFLTIVFLSQLPKAEYIPAWVQFLPRFNASVNGTTALLLLFSLYCIKRKNIEMHKRINITCFILSSLFLVSYVTFHSFGIETKFPTDNPMRPLYLTVLISHIILAAFVLPLILIAFYFGLSMKVAKHKKIVRWAYPVWLYVAVTGVIVYLMISPHYRF